MKKINIIIAMLLFSISAFSQTIPNVTTTGTQTLTNKTYSNSVLSGSVTVNQATSNTIPYFDASKNLNSVTLGAGLSLSSGTLTASGSGSIVSTNSLITVSGSSITANMPFVTPEMFGAVGDGVTNDATALQAAINSSLTIVGDIRKTYLSLSTLTITSNENIQNLNLRLVSNITGISVQGNYNTIMNCSITGTTALGHGSSNIGISAIGNAGLTSYRLGNKISNCYFTNLNTAVYTASMVGTSSGAKHEGSFQIDNSFIEYCTNGIFFDARGEYNNVTNTKIANSTNGIIIRGGNNSYNGGQITDCTNAFVLQTGTNDAHSVASGVMVNHNNFSVLGSQSLTYTFNGCMFYDGNIQLTGAGKTRFVGSEFSMGANTFSINASPSIFNGCEFVAMASSASVTGVSPKILGCYSGTNTVVNLNSTTTGAYILDNGSSAVNILTVYDNGTARMAIQDGGNLQFVDGTNIVMGTTTGTRIGTGTTQRLGFFNATPVVQQTATTDLGTTLSNLGLRASGTAYPITTSGAVQFTGGVRLGYLARTTTYTVLATDYVVDCTTGTFTVTLPTAASVAGRIHEIKNSGTGVITIATTSSQTIDGATTQTLATQYSRIRVMSNGTNWIILSN